MHSQPWRSYQGETQVTESQVKKSDLLPMANTFFSKHLGKQMKLDEADGWNYKDRIPGSKESDEVLLYVHRNRKLIR